MFRATMCPSSGEITIYATLGIRHSVWMTVWYAGWNSILHTRQSSTQSDEYQVSQRYSYFSWWCAHSRPKHVEKRNKHTKKNCASTWLYLQDPHIHLNPSLLSLFYFMPIRLHTGVTLWKCQIEYLLVILHHLTTISDSSALSTKETRTTLTCV